MNNVLIGRFMKILLLYFYRGGSMINLLFYILLATFSLLIAFLLHTLDRILLKKKNMLEIEEQGLVKTNWFLKYELYRRGLINGKNKEF